MSWNPKDLMSTRFDFIHLAQSKELSFSEVCRRFDISRKTGYKWLKRAEGLLKHTDSSEPDLSCLQDRSRRPHRSPQQTSPAIVDKILAVRDKHPTWSGRKIKRYLINHGATPEQLPAHSTITEILKRAGRIEPKQSNCGAKIIRFERSEPNELWQMDYKGHFPMNCGSRCHPLTVLDDCSRFLIDLHASDNERSEPTQQILINAFRRHGLPDAILCDNGPPWGSHGGEYSALEVWLMRLGIRVLHGRPYHPQTQGKAERFHQTLKYDLLKRHQWLNLAHSQQRFDQFRYTYNHDRPHESIDMRVPAQCYRPSKRSYHENMTTLEYDEAEILRVVKRKGEITFKALNFYIGQAFYGATICLKETKHPLRYHVYLGALPIGYIRLDQEPNKPRHNYRKLYKLKQKV